MARVLVLYYSAYASISGFILHDNGAIQAKLLILIN